MVSLKQLKNAFMKRKLGLFMMAIALIFACSIALMACGEPKDDNIANDYNYQQVAAKVNELQSGDGLYVKLNAQATDTDGTSVNYNVVCGAKIMFIILVISAMMFI